MTSALYLNTEIGKLHRIDVHRWNYTGLWNTTIAPLLNYKSLNKTCQEHDIIHVQYDLGGYMPFFLPTLFLASKGTNAKIILTLHEEFDNVPLRPLIIAYHNLWYSIADLLIVHSPQQKNRLPTYLQKKTIIQPHGVIYREDANRNPKKSIILLPGFINPWKGHDIALYALAEVKKQIPDIKLLIIGKPHDKVFTERMHTLAQTLHIEKNITWEEGYVPEEKFFEYYQTSSIGILPYKRITMSGILCHILSWKLPTIFSDLPVFEWFTAHKAVYFRNGDSHNLAEKIIMLLKDKKRQEKMSIDFDNLAKQYSWKDTAQQTLKIYAELVEEKPSLKS